MQFSLFAILSKGTLRHSVWALLPRKVDVIPFKKNLFERAWTTFIRNFVPIPRYISTLLDQREVILISVEGGRQNTCKVRATCRNILCDLIKQKFQMCILLKSFHHKSDTYIEVHFSFHTAVRHYYFNLNYTVYDHTAQFGLNYGWFKRLGKLWTPTKR